jgi:hypothetical protein
MKKLLVLSMLLVSFVSYGQDRVNRSKLSFDQSSEMLTNSIGWSYNETLGEWIDYDNVIDKDKNYKDKYKSLQGAYQMSNNSFKFNNLQVKTLVFEGNKYYILIHDKWTGRYKYPSIQQDWVRFRKVDGYIFTESEYSNLREHKKVTFNDVVEYDLEFEEYNETKFLDLIQTKLSTPKSSYEIKYGPSTRWGMLINKTKEGKIRFLTPTDLKYVEFTPTKMNPYDMRVYNFEKMYFETDMNNFNKLIIK